MEHRECEDCYEMNIPFDKPEWVTRCKNCYVKYKKLYRTCIMCLQNNIPPDKPLWAKKCLKCYKLNPRQKKTKEYDY